MNDQNKRYFQCRYCGKEISHYGGNLFHEVGVVVFPQYCANTYPEQKSVMHEPKMLTMQEAMALSNLQGSSYAQIVPSKDVKPVVIDPIKDVEVTTPPPPKKVVVVGGSDPKMSLAMMNGILKSRTSSPLLIPIIETPIGEFVARFPTREQMTKGMPLMELLDYLEPVNSSKSDVFGHVRRMQLRNEFLHPVGIPDTPIKKQYFAKIGVNVTEVKKQYPVINPDNNNSVAVNSVQGAPLLPQVMGFMDIMDVRFNVFGTPEPFTKHTDRHQIVVDKHYFDYDFLANIARVLRHKAAMGDFPDSYISYFGNVWSTGAGEPDSTDDVEAIYGVNCVLAIYEHFGPDARYCNDFLKIIELVDEAVKEVTKQ